MTSNILLVLALLLFTCYSCSGEVDKAMAIFESCLVKFGHYLCASNGEMTMPLPCSEVCIPIDTTQFSPLCSTLCAGFVKEYGDVLLQGSTSLPAVERKPTPIIITGQSYEDIPMPYMKYFVASAIINVVLALIIVTLLVLYCVFGKQGRTKPKSDYLQLAIEESCTEHEDPTSVETTGDPQLGGVVLPDKDHKVNDVDDDPITVSNVEATLSKERIVYG